MKHLSFNQFFFYENFKLNKIQQFVNIDYNSYFYKLVYI